MPVEFRCPYCGQLLSAPDEAAGTTGSCRFCGASVTAPMVSGAPAVLVSPGNPQAQAQAAPSVGQPTGVLDIGAILSEAWRTLTAHWPAVLGAYYLASFLMMLILMPVMAALMFPSMRQISETGGGMVPQAPMVLANLGLCAVVVLLSPLQAGPFYVIDRLLARGDAGVGDLFLGFRHYGALVQYNFLYMLPSIVLGAIAMPFQPRDPGHMMTALPVSVLLWLLSATLTGFMLATFRLGMMEVVDRGASGLEALKTSYEVTNGHRWMILATWLVLSLAAMAGLVACCVGFLFTVGILPIGEVLVYRHLRGLQGTPDEY